MKTIAKRLFATVLALALMCTMVTGFAANTASIEKVEVYSSIGELLNTYGPRDSFTVTQGQVIKVYATLTDEQEAAVIDGDLTFLSHKVLDVITYNNDTVQYVTQVDVPAEGKAVITFRPRASLGEGEFVAKVSGTGVATPASFGYAVEAALVPLGLTPVGSTSIKENSDADISFTVDRYTTGDLTVKLNGVVLEEGVGYRFADGTLTILNAALIELGRGTWGVVVEGEGYVAATQNVTIDEKDPTPLDLVAVGGVITLYENSQDNIQITVNGWNATDEITVALTKNGEAVVADYESDGTMIIIKNKEVGRYTVTVSGAGYTEASIDFEILELPDTQLTLTPDNQSIEVSATNDIEFTLGNYTEGELVVALGDATLTKDAENGYTLNGTTLTIKNAAIPDEIGAYTLTVDGEGYIEATATITVVADAAIKLGLANGNSIVEESGDSVSFAITGYNPEKPITVAVGNAENIIDSSLYTIVDGVLTIQYSALDTTVGTHTVYVSGNAYEGASATYTVTAKVVPEPDPDEPELPEEDVEDVQSAVNEIDYANSVVGNSFELVKEVTVGETTVELNVETETYGDSAIVIDGDTVTYNPDAENRHFVSKVTITTTVGEDVNVQKTETIYFIPAGTKISFGNVIAIAAADGTDAFAEENFEEYKNTPEALEAQTVALNVVLGRQGKNTIAQQEETLDYDQSGTITLSEYKIFRYMMLGKSGYSWNDVQSVRDKWIEINGVK